MTVATLIAASCGSIAAAAEGDSTAANAIAATTPVIDLRLRSESVDQDGLPENAHAVTLRGRLGAESGEAWGSKFLAEVELVWPLDDDYNDTLNGQTQYPVVADPPKPTRSTGSSSELVDPGDDAGSRSSAHQLRRSALRRQQSAGVQNEQTYDALRVTSKLAAQIDLGSRVPEPGEPCRGQVIRPSGRYTGENYLANVSYALPVGKLTGFAYLLELDEAATDSSSTAGAPLLAEKPFARRSSLGSRRTPSSAIAGGIPIDYREQY